jgi:hypothetical protein
VGRDESWFAYCEKEFPEIAFACCSCTSGDWEELAHHEEAELEDHHFTEEERLHWRDSNNLSTVRDARFDGKNFVIRMEGQCDHENLLSFSCGEDGVLLDYKYFYLALDFND